ncbi:protein networked 4a [Anaeramoeba ignava]|uniref:Protein networked 4a n=1 Tax=Anaeramoeba ignava TaxID=1746090 RepID=A0A9Q0LHX0_ANAIG|nr:protein networked 4a [Anaeramoeba ignava]|eukprot:Anaeramoba_ignava/a1318_195.p1 GENE.a1318_195~~a1318_195.p1  ORF type:complete len:368 (-),score=123.90 a1318_195:278-1381(-)
MGNRNLSANLKELKTARYSKLIHASKEAVICIDENGKYILANSSAAKIVKAKSPKAITKLPPWSLAPKIQTSTNMDNQQMIEYYSIKLSESPNGVVDFDFQMKTLPGEIIWVHMWATPLMLNGKYATQLIFRQIAEPTGKSMKLSSTTVNLNISDSSETSVNSSRNDVSEFYGEDTEKHNENQYQNSTVTTESEITQHESNEPKSEEKKINVIVNTQRQNDSQIFVSSRPSKNQTQTFTSDSTDLNSIIEKIDSQIRDLTSEKTKLIQYQKLMEKYTKLNDEIQEKNSNLSKLQTELDENRRTIQSLNSKVETMETKLKKSKQKKQVLETKLEDSQKEANKQKNEVKRLTNRLKIVEEAKQNLEKLI